MLSPAKLRVIITTTTTIIIYYCECECRHMHAMGHVWRLDDSLRSALSVYAYVGSGVELRSPGLCGLSTVSAPTEPISLALYFSFSKLGLVM